MKTIIRQRINPGKRSLRDYRLFLSKGDFALFENLIRKLSGKKIIYFNATPSGGGVAELLNNTIPLFKSLKLDLDWYAFTDMSDFFQITKKLHNSLQGSKEKLTKAEKHIYVKVNKAAAKELLATKADILMLQDLQTLGVLAFLPPGTKAAARVHVDLTRPNPDSLNFVRPFLLQAEKLAFTLKEYVPRWADRAKVVVSPPGIDPLAEKNAKLTEKQIAAVAEAVGIDRTKPLVLQISRFDRWKNPMGVIQTYKLVKEYFPAVQLVLMGILESQDDPEAAEVYENVKRYVGTDSGVFLIHDKSQLKAIKRDIFINAMQRMADVVFQLSIREGFGLTVTEAMWKEKAVIGGNVGGIKLQIQNGRNGFLVNSPKEAARLAARLIADRKLRLRLGREAKRTVKEKFLITRYLLDELRMMEAIL